jgi:hypothetical protein
MSTKSEYYKKKIADCEELLSNEEVLSIMREDWSRADGVSYTVDAVRWELRKRRADYAKALKQEEERLQGGSHVDHGDK